MKCLTCGEEFIQHRSGHIFCSKKCCKKAFNKAHLKPLTKLLICPVCKNEFVMHKAQFNNSQKYCSSKCRDKRRNKNKINQTKDERDAYRKDWHLRKHYSITLKEFEERWKKCGQKCSICDRELTLPIKSKGQKSSCVVIDHNHKTNKMRGLLCSKCNKGLGLFNDDYNLLQKALEYIKEDSI